MVEASLCLANKHTIVLDVKNLAVVIGTVWPISAILVVAKIRKLSPNLSKLWQKP